jgi:uncharacterized protein
MRALLTLAVTLFASRALGQSTSGTAPIIDMHLHVQPVRRSPDGKPLPRPCVNDVKPCNNPPSRAISDETLLEATLAEMQRNGIVLAFLSGTNLQAVTRWTAAAPDRFIPSLWFGGRPTFPSLDSLRRLYAEGRLKGMGEISSQYGGFAPNDPRLAPYFALAESLAVPVLIHTAGIGHRDPPLFRSALGRPLLLEEVLVRHPKLRLSVENAGYPFRDEMIALMYQYPQVYADLSTITWIIPRAAFHSYVKALLDAGFGQRLMFGSDQMQWPETIGLGIEAIQSAPFLSEEQKRDIFYNNAVRFLRLPASKPAP